MAGGEARLTGSLQFRLSATLSVLIAAVALGAGAFSYKWAFEDAIEWQDANLRQMSSMSDGSNALVDLPTTIVDTVPDPDLEVVVEVVGPSSKAALGGSTISQPLHDGLQTVRVGAEAWRVFARPLDGGKRLIVAQRSAERDEVARDSAVRAILPLATVLPVLIMLVGVVVRQALLPMTVLARDLDRRGEHDAGRLQSSSAPNELQPFIASINSLLAKLSTALAAQRRFVGVAAHELRSPLTALTLQAEQLAARITAPEEREFMARLQAGTQRMRNLLEQLLTLARAEAAVDDGRLGEHSLADVLRSVIEEHLPLAEAKGIDLGVAGELTDVGVSGTPVELHALFRNLVDNAIRYTPAGGRVDLSVRCDGARVAVEIVDDGPGIATEDVEHVFDPFYRVLGTDTEGSGLGLAIVKVMVTRLGGEVSLANDTVSGGLRVRVELPCGAAPPSLRRMPREASAEAIKASR